MSSRMNMRDLHCIVFYGIYPHFYALGDRNDNKSEVHLIAALIVLSVYRNREYINNITFVIFIYCYLLKPGN